MKIYRFKLVSIGGPEPLGIKNKGKYAYPTIFSVKSMFFLKLQGLKVTNVAAIVEQAFLKGE